MNNGVQRLAVSKISPKVKGSALKSALSAMNKPKEPKKVKKISTAMKLVI